MTCALYGTAFTWALNAYGSDGGFSQSAVFLSVVWEAEGIRPQIILLHSTHVCHMPHYNPRAGPWDMGVGLFATSKLPVMHTRQRTLGINYLQVKWHLLCVMYFTSRLHGSQICEAGPFGNSSD